MSDYVEKNSEGRMMLRSLVFEINDLSRAFSVVGNEKIADQLSEICTDINKASGLMDEAFSELLTGSIKATQDATFNMVQTAVNVALRTQ